MDADPRPRCRRCGRPLQPVPQGPACLAEDCPLFGLSQEDCCAGAPLPDPTAGPPAPGPPIPWRPKR